MARWTPQPPPPNTATPVDQALVTPANRPEVLLAVQHTQAVQTLHSECASIRQEIGGLQSEVATLKTDKVRLETDISDLKHLRSKLVGGAIVLGLLAAGLITFCWYFIGPTWVTVQKMAAEYEVHKADREAAKDVGNTDNATMALINQR